MSNDEQREAEFEEWNEKTKGGTVAPTEDTPCDSCFQPITAADKKTGNYRYKQTFNFHVTCPKQDNQQLKTIVQQNLDSAIAIPDDRYFQKRFEKVEARAIAEILAWHKAAQLQLVSELLEHQTSMLPDTHPPAKYVIEAVPAEVLYHKKQELERLR